MPSSSHVYADLSAGFFRLHVSDGSHSHIHRIHCGSSTINNTTDPGSPTDRDSLLVSEGDVNATARNYIAMLASIYASTYTITLLDFQPVTGGVPSGPPDGLLPYSLAGALVSVGFPEAQMTLTFRDAEGAPCRFDVFGGSSLWDPTVKTPLSADWAGTRPQQFAAYVMGVAKTSSPAKPALLTQVVSHHGQRLVTPLNVVCGLNRRLRRSYRVI